MIWSEVRTYSWLWGRRFPQTTLHRWWPHICTLRHPHSGIINSFIVTQILHHIMEWKLQIWKRERTPPTSKSPTICNFQTNSYLSSLLWQYMVNKRASLNGSPTYIDMLWGRKVQAAMVSHHLNSSERRRTLTCEGHRMTIKGQKVKNVLHIYTITSSSPINSDN